MNSALPMRKIAAIAVVCAQAVTVQAQPSHSGAPLYSGVVPDCNEGVVTTNQTHMHCSTRPIGFTIGRGDAVPAANFVEVFVGNIPGKNAGVVSANPAPARGASRGIGYLSRLPIPGGTLLYVGTTPNCNAGQVTVGMGNLSCDTEALGYTVP